MMRTRIAIALATTVGALAAGAVGAGSASAASPPISEKLSAELFDTKTGEVEDAAAARASASSTASTSRTSTPAPTGTVSMDSGCTAADFAIMRDGLRQGADLLVANDIRYSPGAIFNYSSILNLCPFPVRLVHDDGTTRTVSPGQWVWDLGAAPFRIDDRVRNVEPVI